MERGGKSNRCKKGRGGKRNRCKEGREGTMNRSKEEGPKRLKTREAGKKETS
jgi:hypothetical protein